MRSLLTELLKLDSIVQSKESTDDAESSEETQFFTSDDAVYQVAYTLWDQTPQSLARFRCINPTCKRAAEAVQRNKLAEIRSWLDTSPAEEEIQSERNPDKRTSFAIQPTGTRDLWRIKIGGRYGRNAGQSGWTNFIGHIRIHADVAEVMVIYHSHQDDNSREVETLNEMIVSISEDIYDVETLEWVIFDTQWGYRRTRRDPFIGVFGNLFPTSCLAFYTVDDRDPDLDETTVMRELEHYLRRELVPEEHAILHWIFSTLPNIAHTRGIDISRRFQVVRGLGWHLSYTHGDTRVHAAILFQDLLHRDDRILVWLWACNQTTGMDHFGWFSDVRQDELEHILFEWQGLPGVVSYESGLRGRNGWRDE
jgi:hypothetical protein